LLLRGFKKKAAKSNKVFDSILIKGIEHTLLPLVYIGILYFAVGSLEFPYKVENKIHTVFVFLLTLLGIRTIIGVIRIYLNSYFKNKEDGSSREKQISGIVNIFGFIIWSIGLIFLLDNIGFKVSTVIAGLGVGGIAIALAAQAILGDLFSYFVIFFDKPFEIGDFIVVGDKSGTVENIGIKTTRVRSLGGEQIVFSNTNLTSSQLHNYKRMERRRSLFTLRIDFGTPKQKLEEIPKIIKTIIEKQEKVTFDRSHLASVGEYAYIFETVYFVDDPDYKIYMDVQQTINIEICRQLDAMGIKLATSPQTIK
ncbi:MAG: mechanosensitive ion channel family protein, partial [Bacteroidota bacterium]|nr:mechanosensitive ion channel family protein [Bacteroidota bacterium]